MHFAWRSHNIKWHSVSNTHVTKAIGEYTCWPSPRSTKSNKTDELQMILRWSILVHICLILFKFVWWIYTSPWSSTPDMSLLLGPEQIVNCGPYEPQWSMGPYGPKGLNRRIRSLIPGFVKRGCNQHNKNKTAQQQQNTKLTNKTKTKQNCL